ncbi:hypothetical protein T484DRAFT_1797266 [Baffinella frigidus]|nr:hypothetical protein T484DRAFT_1797266 [Cryptophyta sp. CCMP2293]
MPRRLSIRGGQDVDGRHGGEALVMAHDGGGHASVGGSLTPAMTPGEADGEDLDDFLEAEVEDLERELEDAQDARAVAEQVNLRLKGAMEEQSLELSRLRARLVTGSDENKDGDQASGGDSGGGEEMKRLRELLDAKSEEVTQLAEERERGENGLFAARKELRRARRRLAQESHDLIRVRRAGGEGISLVWRCKTELTRLAEEVLRPKL